MNNIKTFVLSIVIISALALSALLFTDIQQINAISDTQTATSTNNKPTDQATTAGYSDSSQSNKLDRSVNQLGKSSDSPTKGSGASPTNTQNTNGNFSPSFNRSNTQSTYSQATSHKSNKVAVAFPSSSSTLDTPTNQALSNSNDTLSSEEVYAKETQNLNQDQPSRETADADTNPNTDFDTDNETSADASVDADTDVDADADADTIQIAGDIIGRVLDDNGLSIDNAIITASPFGILAGQGEEAKQVLTTNSDPQGSYSFNNVATASYRICNTATENYTRSCVQVLPPQRTADIKVKALTKEITLFGRVTNENGSPIENVNIQLNAQNSPRVTTSNDGSYSLSVKLSANDNPSMFFQHKDYSRSSLRPLSTEPISVNQYEINRSLQSLGGFNVKATVVDEEGNPVRGQNVSLRGGRGQSVKFQRTNAQGSATLVNVAAGENYIPVVITSSDYKFTQDNSQIISVFDDSTRFEVRVTSVLRNFGPLNLYIKDQAQLPIENVSFTLRSAGKLIAKKSTDENGELTFENVPDTALTLHSSALPVMVNGLNREQHSGSTITVDNGDNDIVIYILGKNGGPALCQNATLTWQTKIDGLSVRSIKLLVIDQNGIINVSGLGSGEQSLSLKSCPGYRSTNKTINIGSRLNFDVELTPIN